MQGLHGFASMRQVKPDPSTVDVNPKDTVAALVSVGGPLVMVVSSSGSTLHAWVAGVASVLPFEIERTAKV